MREADHVRIYADADSEPGLVAIVAPANQAQAERLALMPIGDDTRGEWLWFRLANGDLVLGFYPCGDAYEDAVNGRGATAP